MIFSNDSFKALFLAVVTIEGNDDENGVFSFNNLTSLEVIVEESDIG